MSQINTSWAIGKHTIQPLPLNEMDTDPRGVLFMFEEPRPNAQYFISGDPTVGKTGWSRWNRTDDDLEIDNAACQVLRKGKLQDVQVAEFAAPVDAVEFAPILNAIGRLYKGNSEEGMAEMIVEATGPGAVTIRELVDRFGYTNQFLWHYYGGEMSPRAAHHGNKIGWYSSRSANKDLWMRGAHHIHNRRVRVYSEHCIEEMADCMADAFTAIGEARRGRHDDRVFALLLCMWLAHGWSTGVTEIDTEARVVQPADVLEAQDSDMDVEEMTSSWNERMSQLQGW
jgi:hypothetical protein